MKRPGGRPKLLTSHSQEERREGARGSTILLEAMSPMTLRSSTSEGLNSLPGAPSHSHLILWWTLSNQITVPYIRKCKHISHLGYSQENREERSPQTNAKSMLLPSMSPPQRPTDTRCPEGCTLQAAAWCLLQQATHLVSMQF